MEEVYMVLARFPIDDVPVYYGYHEHCIDYIEQANKKADWDALRTQVRGSTGLDLSSDPLSFAIFRMQPFPIEMIELIEAE